MALREPGSPWSIDAWAGLLVSIN